MSMNLLMKCNSVKETKAFYADLLDFEVADTAQGTCTVRKAGGVIVFSDAGPWRGNPKLTGTLYFFVSDVSAYYRTVKERVVVRWPLQDMPYGTREFAVLDCNGYTLAFAAQA